MCFGLKSVCNNDMLSILEEQTVVFPSYQEVFDNASPEKQKEIQEPDPTYEENGMF